MKRLSFVSVLGNVMRNLRFWFFKISHHLNDVHHPFLSYCHDLRDFLFGCFVKERAKIAFSAQNKTDCRNVIFLEHNL